MVPAPVDHSIQPLCDRAATMPGVKRNIAADTVWKQTPIDRVVTRG